MTNATNNLSSGTQADDNGPAATGKTEHRQRKPRWRNIVDNFGAGWYSIIMSTGILGILYHQQPYQFTGLRIISTIMYVLSVVLFALFSVPTILRWTVFHGVAVSRTQGSIDEVPLLACPPIAWLQIAALTSLCVSNSYWGGNAWTVVAVVFWWFGAAWMVTTSLGICIDLFTHNFASDRQLSPAIFIQSVGIATAAAVGGLICRYGYDVSPGLAVPVLIFSYLLTGFALFLSLELYSVFFNKLLTTGWPPPPKVPGMFFLVGPLGQVPAAFMLIGSAASTGGDFAGYNRGTFLTSMSGSTVSSAGTLIALAILGHDLFWMVIAFYGVIGSILKREAAYSLMWWALIFPLGTTTTSFIALSVNLNSSTFRVLAAIFTIFLTCAYLTNWVFTIWFGVKGELLIKSSDIEVYDEEKVD